MRLLFATIEPWPTARPDVAALFGKFLPRLAVNSDLVAEAGAGPRWGGGEVLSISGRGPRPARYLLNVLHHAFILFGADRARYQAIQVRDMPLVALIGLLAARIKRLPFFYWMSFPAPEGQILLARQRGLSAGLVRFLFPLLWRGWTYWFLLYRIVLPRADHVFVQTDTMRDGLVARGIAKERLTSVVMGVDLEACRPEAVAPERDPRLDGKRVLVYLGTLARGRRIDILLDMLRILRRQFPDVVLALVGEAEDEVQEKWLRRRARELGVEAATIWTGWLPIEHGWRYVRAAEVGLSPIPRGPLLDCGSPTKVLEYLALGVPVVANDNPDQERVLREGGGGLCVPLTAQDFAQAVSRLLADEGLRRAMAASGQAHVRAARGYDTLAKRVAEKYAELRARPRQELILMFGPSLGYPGGMTEVVRCYSAAGVFDLWPLRYISTYAGREFSSKLRPWALALGTVLLRLAQRRVALLHVHSAAYGSFWRKSALCALALAFRVPYVVHLHDGRLADFYRQGCNRLAKAWLRAVLRKAARVVVLSPHWGEVVRRIEPAARTTVIGNPVRVPAVVPPLERRSRQVLFLGWLQEAKGVLDLVRAMPLVLRAVPGASFVLAGSGETDSIARLARSLGVEHALRMPGWVDGAEKEELLRRAEVFVLPSYYEGLPVGLLEAMACGVPVIATRVGGIPDVIEDRVNGLLVEPGEPQALARALVAVLTDEALRRRLREAAHKSVFRRYSEDCVIADLQALYRDLGVEL